MSIDRLLSDPTEIKSDARHDDIALRWESATGDGRILARGTEALTLYQSDMADGFRGIAGGFMTLGRIQADGSFRPMIRQAIPCHVPTVEVIVIPPETIGDADHAPVPPELLAHDDQFPLTVGTHVAE